MRLGEPLQEHHEEVRLLTRDKEMEGEQGKEVQGRREDRELDPLKALIIKRNLESQLKR